MEDKRPTHLTKALFWDILETFNERFAYTLNLSFHTARSEKLRGIFRDTA